MYFNIEKYSKTAMVLFSAFNLASSFAGTMGETAAVSKGHFLIQLGGYAANKGNSQHIYIAQNLIGNQYTVNQKTQYRGLVGLGYLRDGPVIQNRFPISYGVNAFFLGQTSVNGFIIQENQFTNLSYRYKIQNVPVYFDVKTSFNTPFERINLAVDAGIGPNFMNVSHYHETPLTTFTLPDNAFTDQNNVTLAATVGASLRFNNVISQIPIELGYRFFYLGNGQLNINNSQVLNAVKTGNTYANALVCTITI